MTESETATGILVRHVERPGGGTFYAEEDGAPLGEMTWSRGREGAAVIQHTEVDVTARSRGVGRLLVAAVLAWARASQTKLDPVCSYAAAVLRRDGSAQDVLVR